MDGEKSGGQLEFRLLGSPEVLLDGTPVTNFRSGKARALLYYLVVTARAQPRSVLAGMFWGDVAEKHARRSLTMTLSNLRQFAGHHLDISRETIAFKLDSAYRLDVAAFDFGVEAAGDIVSSERLQHIIGLYRGDFLEGFYVRDAPEFEQWVLVERARLRERVLQALHLLANHLARQGGLPRAIETLRRALALEPWREEAHRQLMLLLAQNGQRSAALAQYEICRQMLAEELDIDPHPRTIELVEQIRAGDLSKSGQISIIDGSGSRTEKSGPAILPTPLQASFATAASHSPAPRHNLPSSPTPFIGRKRELADIIRRLTDRDCRLLTLVGPGGIGKTRLALQTAQIYIDTHSDKVFFEDGIFFVPLAAIGSTGGVVSAFAKAVNFNFYGNVPPKQQLLDYLQNKEMLIVLDNFEHLLSPSPPQEEINRELSHERREIGIADFLSEMLAAAPHLKLLVTSREVINLQEAWIHPVEGLSFPAGEQQQFAEGDQSAASAGLASLADYDAVQLFVRSAVRVKVDFSLAAEQSAIVRVCRLVEGMPLAIELAAAWLKVLTVVDIADEIERGLDILISRHQNLPERHQSMRLVVEQSWQLLSAPEQAVFTRLSVFQDDFAHDAARVVAGAAPIDLATFVDKSLLQVTPSGRYHMHALLRQYAAEQFAEFPEEVAETRDVHCTYFADFLDQHYEALMGRGQRQAIAAINPEYDNIWAAWRWAVKGLKLLEIQKLVTPLQVFCQFQSKYVEGATAWEEAYHRLSGVEATDPVKLTLVHVIIWWGWMLIRLGQLSRAEVVLNQCRALHRELGIPAIPGYGTNPALHLSLIATIRGDYATALQYGEQARQESEAEGHGTNLCQAYYVLASAAFGQGNYETAQHYAHQANALAQKADDRWFIAYCLNVLGKSDLALGHVTLAQQHFEASYTLRQEFNDPEGMAVALNHLGEIALRQQDYDRARKLYLESLAIYQDISDKGGLATTLKGLGVVASKHSDLKTAHHYLQQALQLAADIDYVPLILSILKVLGELWLKNDRPELGLMTLVSVRQHAPKDEVQQLLDSYAAAGGEEMRDILAAAEAEASNRTLPEVVAQLLEETEKLVLS